ncbi:MAG: ABC transporter permease [Candidatus Omnitrophica bacterium]|nr:ABC transporter permease [Candidatus Omnitrophota bacterium]
MSALATVQGAHYTFVRRPPETLALMLSGRLDADSLGSLWSSLFRQIDSEGPAHLVVDAAQVDYCDGSGIGLVLELARHQKSMGRSFKIEGLREEYLNLLKLYTVSEVAGTVRASLKPTNTFEEIGRSTLVLWRGTRGVLSFVGELCATLARIILNPRLLRWQDTLVVVEKAGVNSFPIIALVGFLIGLIMSFQSAIAMRMFGAEIFVANFIGISLFRELGPLMTAIILAGRSGAAFAAEIGTMKVNEEIDALNTMGIDPVRFLAVTRVIASVVVTPLLAIFASLFGLIGGAIVYSSLGFPLITFVRQIQFATTYVDLMGGLVKAAAFGLIIAGLGCRHGLMTKSGASAVGDSTTQAVVNILILIVVADGVFSVLYYNLGI